MLNRKTAVLAVALLVGCSTPGASASTSPEATAEPTTTFAPTTEPTPTRTPRPTPEPTPAPAAREDLVVVEQGFTAIPESDTNWAQVGIVLENPNADTHVAQFVNIQLTFYDANGALAGSSEELVTSILPGQRAALGRPVFDAGTATEMEVVVRADWTTIDFAAGSFTFSEVTTSPASFGGWETRGFVESAFEDEQETVEVVAIYKDAAGNVVGGDSTYVDFVPAGGRSPFEISTFSQFNVPVTTTDMYATPGF